MYTDGKPGAELCLSGSFLCRNFNGQLLFKKITGEIIYNVPSVRITRGKTEN